jgi:protein-tyrosine phosphatase
LHVLFVCTGNICRSPIAERLAGLYATQLEIPNFVASSAGVQAVVGHSMHRYASVVLESYGVDPSGFVARQFTTKLASNVDLVLTMSMSHRDAVLERVPALLQKTFTVSEARSLAVLSGVESIADMARKRAFVSPSDHVDIADPIGGGVDTFESVGAQIAEAVRPIIEFCGRC